MGFSASTGRRCYLRQFAISFSSGLTTIAELLLLILYICFSISTGFGLTISNPMPAQSPNVICTRWEGFAQHAAMVSALFAACTTSTPTTVYKIILQCRHLYPIGNIAELLPHNRVKPKHK